MTICNFQVGELVRYTAPDLFKRSADPKFGVVIEIKGSGAYWVRWSCGRDTTEHPCYLRGVKNGNL